MKITKKFFKPIFCCFFLLIGLLLILGAWEEVPEFQPGNAMFEDNAETHAYKAEDTDNRIRRSKEIAAPQPPSRIEITTTDDSVYGWRSDAKKPCSLREAIISTNEHQGPDTIVFKLSTNDPGYDSSRNVWVFKFKSRLPIITDNETTIDGHWTPVSMAGSNPSALIGCKRPVIELDGKGVDRGFLIQGNRNTIKGLAIYNFNGPGIRIEGRGNTVVCNYLGTNADQMPNIGNVAGVALRVKGANNRIGKAGAGNLISGNKNNGVLIYGNVTNTHVEGNYIGVKTDGITSLSNRTGISIENGSSENKIGGVGKRSKNKCNEGCNIVSGNKEHGIRISESDRNVVVGCFIGIGADGRTAVGNGLEGILIIGSHNNRIGGGLDDLRNVISGNRNGIVLKRTTNRKSVINKIEGNYIGTNMFGTEAVPNLQRGIYITTSSEDNIIGGSYNQGNIIGGNQGAGITIDINSSLNKIRNNWIGTNKTGGQLGNGQGVALYRGAKVNWIGGDPAHANEIAYNNGDGVHVEGNNTINNAIASNAIHHNAGKGISLMDGGNGKHPKLRIWQADLIDAATNEYFIVGQLDPVFAGDPGYRIAIYSDNEDEGQNCEVALVETPMPADPMRIGWFSTLAKLRGSRFTFTISDNLGHNTSEFLLAHVKPAHTGNSTFDMDYWEVDPDNHIPLNPHFHGGWAHWPPTKSIKKLSKPWSWFKKMFIKCCEGAVNSSAVSHLRGWLCGYFMTFQQTVMFNGDIYWESFMDDGIGTFSDTDNNFGLWTPAMAGVNMNSQRYLNPREPDVKKRLECPPGAFGCDARDWENFDLGTWIAKNKYFPLLTLEIDRDETFDHWNAHPYWGRFDGYNGPRPGPFEERPRHRTSQFRDWLDGKKAMVIGRWALDGYHYCRAEVHPVYGLAIQDKAPDSGSPGSEVWHFFMRRKGGQAVCGGEAWEYKTDWYFRFKGRSLTPSAKVINVLTNNPNGTSIKLTGPHKSNDIVLKIHLPDLDDRICGTVIIDWK